MIKKGLGFCILITLTVGCFVPSSVSRLHALHDNTFWYFGKEFVSKSVNGITVSIAFEKNYQGCLIFDIEYVNESDTIIIVSPEMIFYEAFDKDSLNITYAQWAFAKNPEDKLLEIDKEISIKDADMSNNSLWGFIEETLNLATDVASIGKDISEEDREQQLENREVRRMDRYLTEVKIEDRVHSLNNNRLYWSSVLRKTTLSPGYSIRGRIEFQRVLEAKYYTFTIPVSNDFLKFKYIHEIFKAH